MLSRRSLLWALRIAAAAGLVFVLAYNVDWSAVPEQFERLSWKHATLAVIGLTTQFVVGPWKWQAALHMHELHFRLGRLIRAYGIGMFFNNFLPSGMGGDAYRIMSTWPEDGEGSRAVSAVLIERAVGFAVLLTIGVLGALSIIDYSYFARRFVWVSVAAAAAAALLIWALHSGYARALARRLQHIELVAAIVTDVHYLRRGGQRWFSLIAISVVFQAFAIASIYFLFQALGSPLSPVACALIGAASGFAAVVPISIAGLGVVEGSFAATALALGAPYETSLAAALLMRLLILPQSLVFGLIYALNGERKLRTTSPQPAR